jgi:hypothetical protein
MVKSIFDASQSVRVYAAEYCAFFLPHTALKYTHTHSYGRIAESLGEGLDVRLGEEVVAVSTGDVAVVSSETPVTLALGCGRVRTL